MDRILITGGSGFIGYHFHQALAAREIVNIDLSEPQFPASSLHVAGDIREPRDMDRAFEKGPFSSVICLAAEHKDFGIPEDDYFRTNELGTKVICDSAARHGVNSIVFFSSVAVYGPQDEPTTEDTVPRPATPYGTSKLAGETMLKAWAAADPARRAIILRPTVVFGERNLANMLRLILQIDSGRYANIGSADNVKSIAYVKNVVQAALYLLKTCGPGVSTYNYSDEPQLSVAEISSVIARALGKRRPPSIPFNLALALGLPFDALIRLTARDLPVSTARIRKLCAATEHRAGKIRGAGFRPEYTSRQGLERMCSWFAEEKTAGRKPAVAVSSSG